MYEEYNVKLQNQGCTEVKLLFLLGTHNRVQSLNARVTVSCSVKFRLYLTTGSATTDFEKIIAEELMCNPVVELFPRPNQENTIEGSINHKTICTEICHDYKELNVNLKEVDLAYASIWVLVNPQSLNVVGTICIRVA